MASELTLDRSDPGIDEMVSSWENGGEYSVNLKIRQTASDPNTATFEVIEAESDEAAPPAEGEAPPEEGEGGPPPKGKMGKPSIMIAFGHR